MDPVVESFTRLKHIAVVGVSRTGQGFGAASYKELKQRGYTVFAVNPQADKTVEGDPCYPSLAALPAAAPTGETGAVIVVPPAQALAALQDAASAGIRRVWLQPGASSPEVLARAKDLGLEAVDGRCILMYAGPVQGFHKFHLFFAKLFGGAK